MTVFDLVKVGATARRNQEILVPTRRVGTITARK